MADKENADADNTENIASESEDSDDSESSINEMGALEREKSSERMKAIHALSSIICDKGISPAPFLRFINSLNPCFLAKAYEVEAHCLNIYSQEKTVKVEILKKLDGRISLSADIVYNAQRYDGVERYLCLKAHFIDDDWKLKSWVLSYRPVWGGETFDDDAFECPDTIILKILQEMEISNKISTLTMVGGDLFSETVKSVENYINKKNLTKNRQFSCVCCVGDMISHMAQDAFGKIHNIFEKLHLLCGSSYLSPLWSIRNFELHNAIEMEAMGECSSKSVTDNYEIPSVDEWNKVRSIHKLMDRIYKVATMLFSETKQFTSNIYLCHIVEIQSILIEESTGQDDFLKTVASNMLQRFNEYMKEMRWVLSIATLLDPRFKLKYIDFSSSKFIGDDEMNSDATSFLERVQKLYNDYDTQTPEKNNFEFDSNTSDSEEEDPIFMKKEPHNIIDEFSVLNEYNQFVRTTTQAKRSELDLYLEEPVLPWSKDFNVLAWWKIATAKYPILSRVARDFLAIPMSLAVASDSFATYEREADPQLTSLKPGLMNALMCTQSWYEKP